MQIFQFRSFGLRLGCFKDLCTARLTHNRAREGFGDASLFLSASALLLLHYYTNSKTKAISKFSDAQLKVVAEAVSAIWQEGGREDIIYSNPKSANGNNDEVESDKDDDVNYTGTAVQHASSRI